MVAAADKKVLREARILTRMVTIYCQDNHPDQDKSLAQKRGILEGLQIELTDLCNDCSKLLMHGLVKLLNCPFDPKPRCKRCPTPCYASQYRDFVKLVMRYSGLELIKSGRVDLIWKYFF